MGLSLSSPEAEQTRDGKLVGAAAAGQGAELSSSQPLLSSAVAMVEGVP